MCLSMDHAEPKGWIRSQTWGHKVCSWHSQQAGKDGEHEKLHQALEPA